MRRPIATAVLLIASLAAVSVPRPGAASDVPPYRLDPAIWQRAVVTEVMVNPEAAPDETGQWLELSNLGSEAVNLQGMVLATRSGGFHLISPTLPLILAPGQMLVMGPATDPAQNGGVDVGYSYGGDLLLTQESEILMLLWSNALVDFATWGNGVEDAIEAGRSWSLEPPAADGTGFKEWCPGRSPCGDGTDRGTPGAANEYCDNDGDGYAEDQGDCQDDNATVSPAMDEQCNGIDEDCDGQVDEDVPPLPICLGMGVCGPVVARCAGAAGWVCEYPATFQEVETRCDGLDNDCDGRTDEDLAWQGLPLGAACRAPGVCGDGTVECSPLTLQATCSTLWDGSEAMGRIEECNSLDDDCDGFTDEDFGLGQPCSSGLGACQRTGLRVCREGGGTRCDTEPGTPADEVCGDGIDNDCDGEVDEGFPVGETCAVGVGACRAIGKQRCSEDGLSTVCMATPALPVTEVCGDGIDNDCDGTIDEAGCVTAGTSGNGCAAGPSGGPSPGWLPAWLLALGIALRAARRRA